MVLLILSCTTVEIKDHEICGDLGLSGASCFHTLNMDQRDLDYAQWSNERVGQLCMTADSWADFKSDIEKLCSSGRNCTYEEQAALKSLDAKLETFKRRYLRY